MKILFVTGMFAKNETDTILGGMARAVYNSAKGMQQLGHEVSVMTLSDRYRDWVYKDIKVKEVPAYSSYKVNSPELLKALIIKREQLLAKEIEDYIKQNEIDIIQYSGWMGIGMFPPKNVKKLMRVSTYSKYQLKDVYSNDVLKVLSKIEQTALKQMDYIFAPGKITAKEIEKDINRKVFVIETPYVKHENKKDFSLYNKCFWEKDYLLFFGRKSKDKGVMLICDILKSVLAEFQDLYIAFCGPSTVCKGVQIDEIIKEKSGEYSERVLLFNSIPSEKLIPIIENARCILIPSLKDNLPNACNEAMALRQIIVGSFNSSLEQMITNGKDGFLIENNNSDDLYDKIKHVLSLPKDDVESIKDNAQKRVLKKSLYEYSCQMESIYKKLIGEL